MILLTHPRSGSEWFLHGLTDVRYGGWELFSELQRPVAREGALTASFKGVSFDAKLTMLRALPTTRAHKVFASHLVQAAEGFPHALYAPPEPRAPELLATLKRRPDVYLLRRRNVRAAVLSLLIGYHNGHNYHGATAGLTTPFTVAYHELFHWTRSFTVDLDWAAALLPVQEALVYEDLLTGSQVPCTVAWDGAASPVRPRDSSRYYHLVRNLDEVNGWFDGLNAPGAL